MSTVTTGVRRSMDIRGFLKNAKSGGNSIKYSSESGKSHRLYVPETLITEQDENGNVIQTKSTISEMHIVHEWVGKDGKFKSALCLAELGKECPFCDRVGDSWDVYKYRYNSEKESLMAGGMTDEQATYEMDGDKDKKVGGKVGRYRALLDQRKMKESKPYFYLLVAQFELDAQSNPICEAGMPKFELKVMKLSESRTEKLMKSLETSGGNLEGQELKIDYTATDDVAERVGQSTTTVVFPQFAFVNMYQGLKEKIDAEAAQFSWDGIEKSFGELYVYTNEGAKELCDDNFKSWDTYKKELEVNPNAKYLEYKTAATDRPALTGGIPTPQIGAPAPAAPAPAPMAAPAAPTMAAPAAPVAPTAAPAMAAPAAPAAPAPTAAPAPAVAPAPTVNAAPVTGAPVQLQL